MTNKTTQERLDAYSFPVTESGCWIWMGSLNKGGYGQFHLDGTMMNTHRVSWQFNRGPIPAGLSVLHRCDIKCCINPDHLFLGTAKDNARDMIKKGRAPKRNNRGDKNPNAKLSSEKAAEILRSSDSRSALAKKYGVSLSTVDRVRYRETWA